MTGLAGCAQQREPNPTPTPPPASKNTVERVPPAREEHSMQFGAQTVLPEIVALNSPDSLGVYGNRSTQFLLVEIIRAGKKLPSLTLTVGRGSYKPLTQTGSGHPRIEGYGELYGAGEDDTGLAVFRLPNPLRIGDRQLALSSSGGSQLLGASVRARLTRPPTSFAVAVETVDELSVGDAAELSVTVRNIGSVDGRFVGALNRAAPLIPYIPVAGLELAVPAGETSRWAHEFEFDRKSIGDGQQAVAFRVDWRGGSASELVRITRN
jgi:hypothetical protein